VRGGPRRSTGAFGQQDAGPAIRTGSRHTRDDGDAARHLFRRCLSSTRPWTVPSARRHGRARSNASQRMRSERLSVRRLSDNWRQPAHTRGSVRRSSSAHRSRERPGLARHRLSLPDFGRRRVRRGRLGSPKSKTQTCHSSGWPAERRPWQQRPINSCEDAKDTPPLSRPRRADQFGPVHHPSCRP
jgi:hypothetical protein